MNNMGFFNPFGSSGSGGGGGGGSTANYSVKAITDDSGQVSYKLTKNGTAVGDVISFNGSNMLVNYGGELIVLNSAIAGIEEALDKTYNFTTFTELGINTQNKTISQLSSELAAKNLEEGTVVTGRVYSEALPYNNYGNAEVLVNNSIFWWKTSSSTISPYSWNAIVVGNTVKMDWTPTYYQLPIASAQSLGGVKIGDNVQIAPDGTISVITTKGDTGTGIASIAKTSSSGLNDIYTITYTDSTTSTFTVTNGATITGGSIGQTGHLILTMSDGRTIDAGALPTDNEVEVTTTSSQPADPNVELWVDLSTQQTLDIPEINDSSTSSTQDTWSCKKIYDEQQRQETEIGVVANAGAKNNADFTFGGVVQNANVKPGTIVCVEDNGTFIFSGASADKNYAAYVLNRFSIKAGTYKISGVSGGSNTTYWMRVGTETTDVGLFNLYNGEREFTLDSDTLITVQVVIYANQTVSNLIFKPMIRRAEITDDTFVPYAKTNRELTVAEDEDRSALIAQVDGGAKNLLDTYVSTLKKYNTASSAVWNGSSYTQNGITYSVNSDGTISVSGTATSTSFLVLANRTYLNTKITRGRYSISGCPTGGGSSGATYRIFCLNPNANISNGYTDTGNGYIGEFYYDDSKDCNISIGIGKGCVITDPVVFKPMLCTAADYAISPAFVPYAPTNRELYEMIQALTATITPMTQNEYDALVTKDKPIYFVYET